VRAVRCAHSRPHGSRIAVALTMDYCTTVWTDGRRPRQARARLGLAVPGRTGVAPPAGVGVPRERAGQPLGVVADRPGQPLLPRQGPGRAAQGHHAHQAEPVQGAHHIPQGPAGEQGDIKTLDVILTCNCCPRTMIWHVPGHYLRAQHHCRQAVGRQRTLRTGKRLGCFRVMCLSHLLAFLTRNIFGPIVRRVKGGKPQHGLLRRAQLQAVLVF